MGFKKGEEVKATGTIRGRNEHGDWDILAKKGEHGKVIKNGGKDYVTVEFKDGETMVTPEEVETVEPKEES